MTHRPSWVASIRIALIGSAMACACGASEPPSVAHPTAAAHAPAPGAAASSPQAPAAVEAVDDEGRRFRLDGVTVEITSGGDVRVDGRTVETDGALANVEWEISGAETADVTGDGRADLLLRLEGSSGHDEEDDGAESGVWSSSSSSSNGAAVVVVDAARSAAWAAMVGYTSELSGESSTEGRLEQREAIDCSSEPDVDWSAPWELDCRRCTTEDTLGRHPMAEPRCERSSTRRRIRFEPGDPPLRVSAADPADDPGCACLGLSHE